jgi:phenylacetate-CoA ligase
MSEHFDARETRVPAEREAELLRRLPALVAAALRAPGWRRHLGEIDPARIDSRERLAGLPVLSKAALPGLQRADPPFGGFVPGSPGRYGRLFTSPGPILEPEAAHPDAWRAARALHAAGFRAGDVVLNTFSYHLTPGGFILDGGARALGCAVIPAGPGNTEQQLELIAAYRPRGYIGTPDFLKILLDAAAGAGRPIDCIERALVSGAAFPASLQTEFRARGIEAYQAYATADLGVIAYESVARSGLVVNEDVLLEIVGPDGLPVPEGEVGEVVVTSFDEDHPWIRLGLGDLSALMPGLSPCGRTAPRIRGWMGRADQTTKVKGMFVRPEQIQELARRHPQVGRLRLVVSRADEQDRMLLRAEAAGGEPLAAALADTLRSLTKIGGTVELVPAGSLPDDGKLIEDRRSAS